MTMAEREVVKLPEDQLQNPAVAERRVQQAGFGSATQNSAGRHPPSPLLSPGFYTSYTLVQIPALSVCLTVSEVSLVITVYSALQTNTWFQLFIINVCVLLTRSLIFIISHQ